MTAKEKGLLFTLKVILEMEMENLGFKKGVDFNESEVKSFKIKNETIYFPFTAVNGIGEKVAEKIVCYRNNNKRIKF
jgi:DNA polymerase III alpha subunit (gram-positive type)